jgi:glycine dehydrogenase subunit 2
VLNANYIRASIKDIIDTPYDENCRHEFVASAQALKRETGVRALDIGKALLDRGYHAPTVYFPLLVPESIMIEPTETESKETLDGFIAAFRDIVATAATNAAAVLDAPVNTAVGRIDETRAARQPNLRWHPPSREATGAR